MAAVTFANLNEKPVLVVQYEDYRNNTIAHLVVMDAGSLNETACVYPNWHKHRDLAHYLCAIKTKYEAWDKFDAETMTRIIREGTTLCSECFRVRERRSQSPHE